MAINITNRQAASVDHLRLCLAHADPEISSANYDVIFAFKKGLKKNNVYAGDIRSDISGMYDLLFSSVAVFTLPEYIDSLGLGQGTIGLCTYRKSLCQSVADGKPYVDGLHYVFHPDSFPVFEYPQDHSGTLHLGLPVAPEGGVLQHYKNYHKYPADYVYYALLARELGVFTDEDLLSFLRMRVILAGCGEIGVYPAQWYCRVARLARKIGLEFVRSREQSIRQYDAHQVRVVSFLTERFFTYMLMKDYNADFAEKRVSHYPFAVVEDSSGNYSPGVIPDSERK